jgi:hypothetical protein
MISRERFTEASIEKFLVISKKIYGHEELISKTEFVRNKHLLNPDGKSLYYELGQNGLATGRIAVQFRKAANSAASEQILKNPVDLVSFGSNPFGGLNLYKESLTTEENLEPTAIYHSSNPKSEIFYRRILKEIPVAELSYRAIPLSPAGKGLILNFLKLIALPCRSLLATALMVSSIMSRLEILGSSKSTDSEMVVLFEGQKDLILLRDKERLDWRFPAIDLDADYKRIEFYKREKFCGYLVFRKIDTDGYKALVIVDLYTIKLNRFDYGRIFKLLITYAKGMNLIFTVANFENKKLRSQFPFPFLKVPKRFEPQKFPIYSPIKNKVLNLKKESYITLFDLDVM